MFESPLEPLDLPHLLPKKRALETPPTPDIPAMASSSPATQQINSQFKYNQMNMMRGDVLQPSPSPQYMYPMNSQPIYGGFLDPNYAQNIPYAHPYPPCKIIINHLFDVIKLSSEFLPRYSLNLNFTISIFK